MQKLYRWNLSKQMYPALTDICRKRQEYIMGFFSFKTADKGESIANIFAKDHPNANKTVYMLEPNGGEPISEPSYCGYGRFGGTDCFEWVARRNLSTQELKELENSNDSEALRAKGIGLHYGGALKYPLKFSFNRNAQYEDLEPSESCEYQGYFYGF